MDKRLEKRFKHVYTKMRSGSGKDSGAKSSGQSSSSEIKALLEEFRKASREDLATMKMAATEIDKQKVRSLADMADSLGKELL